ncbi:MAG: efflux RND transporter permease subunit [Phycisphaeraceae bacterium]|nr:efflux RND transporter permease subunit [Phycisphaerae bacterium]MBX3391785.1 efflux RND transporter permease subunit [Phycisphaeraceae bacterium]
MQRRSFTDLFIRRPVLAVVVNLIIIAVGWRSIDSLPVRQYPRIESSSVVITTAYIGASAQTVRGFITTPIERAVAAIDGIDYIESTSTAGISTITVHLRLNHPSTDALAEISARLNQVRSELPPEAESPSIEITRTDKPFATFYISCTSSMLDLTQLTEYLSREIQPRLTTIEGVQRVEILGGSQLAMRVWLDAERMAALDITPQEAEQALRRNNFLASVGKSKGPDVQTDLLTDTDLRSPEEFRQLVVRQRDGAIVRLGDIARIELGSEERTTQCGFNGQEAAYLSVWPLPTANELEVAARLRAELAGIATTLAAGVEIKLAYDGTYYMENALREITKTLAETIAIVGLIVYLFMGSLRTVLVPMIAMPISLIGACLAMLLFNFSLNLLTILAIVLSVGLVVDDAIVMVENVERHVREGKTRFDAALLGARELFRPVVSMTITLAAVYAPIGFQGGLTGVLFREFAFTLASAVVISGIVAVTLSPVMSAALVAPHGREGRLTRFVNNLFESVRHVYGRLLDQTLQLRWTMAAAAVLIAAGAAPLYMMSKKELAPTEDEGGVFFVLLAAPDASLEYTTRAAAGLSESLRHFPETKNVWQVLFVNNGFGGLQAVEWNKRSVTSQELQGRAFGAVAGIPGLQIIPVLPKPLPGAGNFDVELVLTSADDPEQMAQIAEQLVGECFESGLFMYADTDLKIDLPQSRINIDKQKVADLGLDLASVGRDLSVLLSGNYVNRFNYDGRSYKVIPQIEGPARTNPEQILQLKIRAGDGGLVSISSFVTLETISAPRSLNRFQQRNSVKIQGVVRPGVTKGEALDWVEARARELMPPGYAADFAGESRQLRTEGSSLAVTLGFALGLIYLVLAAQFASFRDPLIVLLGSVPLAISGALVFTFINLTTINIYSQVGLITLVGLVAKNGILIVEFANKLQEMGLTKFGAVREAAITRLRPILMTSAATAFGHFPLVLVTGPGAEARNSIGIVLVSGMVVSTIFTLFFVPSVYLLIAREHSRVRRPESRLLDPEHGGVLPGAVPAAAAAPAATA